MSPNLSKYRKKVIQAVKHAYPNVAWGRWWNSHKKDHPDLKNWGDYVNGMKSNPRRRRNEKKLARKYPTTFEGWLNERGEISMPWYAPGYYVVVDPRSDRKPAVIYAVRESASDTKVVRIEPLRNGKFEVGVTGRVRYGTQPEDSHKVTMSWFYRYDTRTYKSFSKAMQKYVEKLLGGKPTSIRSLDLNPRKRSR